MSNNAKYIKNNMSVRFQHWQMISVYLIIYDAIAVTLSYFFALLLRFDFRFSMIPLVYYEPWKYFAPLYATLCIIVFWRLRLYKSIWRFASYKELQRVVLATVVTTIIHIIGVTAALRLLVRESEFNVNRMPLSYYIIGALLQFLLIVGIRFSYRFILLLRSSRAENARIRCAVYGAGSAGQLLCRDIKRTRAMEEQIEAIFDDNKNKWGRDLDGVPVVGANYILGTT